MSQYNFSGNTPVQKYVVENKKDVIIAERSFQLNRSKCKFVSIGLKYGAECIPVITLCGNQGQRVIFTEEDWKDLLYYQGVITNYLYTVGDSVSIDRKNYSVEFEKVQEAKVIKISQTNCYIYLGYESICKLWEVLPLIQHHINHLKQGSFDEYLKSLYQRLRNNTGNFYENVLRSVDASTHIRFEDLSNILELVYVYPEVLKDVYTNWEKSNF
ncbi:uncharacterized protein LOC126890924 [Diabrotica virgifera virgifera]|uniref:Uncharacterized protein n=1 Tax=Diabrotica virgifera virgifera TaxID=50390 RepID=A0ABM5L0T7_DIAVI|nr:uncharacterized protein LOC126890924 [Diabrotica virgifera virgifera]